MAMQHQSFRHSPVARAVHSGRTASHLSRLSVRRVLARPSVPVAASASASHVRPESEVAGMEQFLNKLKYNQDGLLAVIVQVDLHRTVVYMTCTNVHTCLKD